jgi:hypothetical protein
MANGSWISRPRKLRRGKRRNGNFLQGKVGGRWGEEMGGHLARKGILKEVTSFYSVSVSAEEAERYRQYYKYCHFVMSC